MLLSVLRIKDANLVNSNFQKKLTIFAWVHTISKSIQIETLIIRQLPFCIMDPDLINF